VTFHNGVELVEVVLAVFDVGRQSERGKVTHSWFVGRRVLDNLDAGVEGFNGADILPVRFSCQLIISIESRAVDADFDAHYQVLESFGDAAVDAEEVGSLDDFESEANKNEVRAKKQ